MDSDLSDMTVQSPPSSESSVDWRALGKISALVIAFVAVIAVLATVRGSESTLMRDAAGESLDSEIYVANDSSFTMVIPSDWEEPVVIERAGGRLDVFHAPFTEQTPYATHVTISTFSVAPGTTLEEEMQLEAQIALMNLIDVRTASVGGEELLIGRLSPVAEGWGHQQLRVMHQAGDRVASAALNVGTEAFDDEVEEFEPFLLSLRSIP